MKNKEKKQTDRWITIMGWIGLVMVIIATGSYLLTEWNKIWN